MLQSGWRRMAVLALSSLAMGLYFIMLHDSRLQAEADLLQASGQLSWLKKHRYGVHFALIDQPLVFSYSNNAGSSGQVKKALEAAGEMQVSLRYQKETHGPLFSDDRYHSVWEIQIDQQVVRTYPQIRSAIAASEKLVPWFGWFSVCAGIYLVYLARKSYRTIKRNAQFHHLFPWS